MPVKNRWVIIVSIYSTLPSLCRIRSSNVPLIIGTHADKASGNEHGNSKYSIINIIQFIQFHFTATNRSSNHKQARHHQMQKLPADNSIFDDIRAIIDKKCYLKNLARDGYWSPSPSTLGAKRCACCTQLLLVNPPVVHSYRAVAERPGGYKLKPARVR